MFSGAGVDRAQSARDRFGDGSVTEEGSCAYVVDCGVIVARARLCE